MFVIFVRVLIIYLTVLIFLRIMGKRQIGEMQPYELVITLIIADLATLPMSDNNIPLLNGILPLAILVIIHFVITMLTRKNIFFRRFISGKPVIVISPNGIEFNALKQLNMNLDDLLESLRQSGYYSFDQILYAIIETNGKMSLIPTSQNAPATAEDVGVENPPAELSHVVISNGKIVKDEMDALELNNEKINKILKYIKAKQIKQVCILAMDKAGKVYYQLTGKNYQLIDNIYKDVKLWEF